MFGPMVVGEGMECCFVLLLNRYWGIVSDIKTNYNRLILIVGLTNK